MVCLSSIGRSVIELVECYSLWLAIGWLLIDWLVVDLLLVGCGWLRLVADWVLFGFRSVPDQLRIGY